MDSPGATLPPPSPPDPPAPRAPVVALASVALLAAGVMALLWLNARGDANDAAAERDALVTERDLANDANVDLTTELQVVRSQLDTAQQDLADARAGTDTTPTDGIDQGDIDALEDEIAELSDELERLRDENEMLTADLDAAQTDASAPGTTPPDTSPDAPGPSSTPTPSTIAAPTTVPSGIEPLSPAEIGNAIAGLFRNDVLGPGQEECIGQTVGNELGADVVTAILAGDDPSANESLVTAIRNAVSFCGIDPTAVFGN